MTYDLQINFNSMYVRQAFSVVPDSHLCRTLTEVKEKLGQDYCEYRIEGKAGLCIIVDSATFHTRLDGDGEAGRRIM